MSRFTFRSPTLRAKIVTAAFVPYLAGMAYGLWHFIKGLGYASDLAAGVEYSQEELEAFDATSVSLDHPLIALRIVGMIAFCFWVYRVAKNVAAFGLPGESAGLVVGSFFIPILNLWRPFTALVNVWNASDPRSEEERAARPDGTPFLFTAWWIAWISSIILGRIVLVASADTPTTPQAWASNLHWVISGFVVELVAFALMLAVVWRLTQRQELRGAPAIPRAEAV